MAARQTIQLGSEYKDLVTGFKGIATSLHIYLNGCERVALQPTELHEGKPIEPQMFDTEQLVLTKGKKVVLNTQQETGGPGDAPKARFTPKR